MQNYFSYRLCREMQMWQNLKKIPTTHKRFVKSCDQMFCNLREYLYTWFLKRNTCTFSKKEHLYSFFRTDHLDFWSSGSLVGLVYLEYIFISKGIEDGRRFSEIITFTKSTSIFTIIFPSQYTCIGYSFQFRQIWSVW